MGEEPENEAILLLILDSWRAEKGNRVCNFDLSQGSLPLATADSWGILGTVGQGEASLPPLLDGRSTPSHDHPMSPDIVQCPWGATGHPPPMRPFVFVAGCKASFRVPQMENSHLL